MVGKFNDSLNHTTRTIINTKGKQMLRMASSDNTNGYKVKVIASNFYDNNDTKAEFTVLIKDSDGDRFGTGEIRSQEDAKELAEDLIYSEMSVKAVSCSRTELE
jgi:formylmethanofuran dehydrogenase subunit E